MNDSPLIKILLALIPVLSVTLYMLGLTYYEGYLGSYGVEPTLFLLPSDVTLLYGFFALLQIGFQPFYMIFLIVVSLFFIVFVVVILSSHSSVKELQIKLATYLQKIKPSEKTSEVIDKGSTVYLYIFGVFFIVILPYFLAIQSIKYGEEHAERNKIEFKNQTGKWVMLYSTHSNSPVKAQQISCSSTHCAFWLGQETVTLTHDKINKVVAYKNITKDSKVRGEK